MCKYLDICVDLKKSRNAKDGLHQYRNVTLQQAPASTQVGLRGDEVQSGMRTMRMIRMEVNRQGQKSTDVLGGAEVLVSGLVLVHDASAGMGGRAQHSECIFIHLEPHRHRVPLHALKGT